VGRIPLALALGVLALAPASAGATIYPVNSNVDESDGTCVPAPGDCSLRDAVGRANALGDVDEIQLPPGDYELTLNSQLLITQPVDVLGVSGATPRNTTVRGNDMGTGERIIQVHANATLANFTVFNGKGKGAGTIDGGGGIRHSAGNLVLRNMLLAGNTVNNGGEANGGGIYHFGSGTLAVESTSIIGNSVVGGSGTDLGLGGGIRIGGSSGEVTITNTTIDSNSATGPAGSQGGGIMAAGPSTVTLQNVTVTSNTVTGGANAGGNLSHAGTVNARNTIIAYGSAPLDSNCFGGLNSLGGNIEPGTSCDFSQSTDKNADPVLAPVGNNGGPTNTRAFTSTSPAFNAGLSTGCPGTDQRGIVRPQGSACDMGAFELEVPVPPGPGPGPAPGPLPSSDTKAPLFSAYMLRPATFPAALSGGSVRAAVRRRRRVYGTRVSFLLDEPAVVTFTVQRRTPGRRVGRRCVRPTRANRRRPRCIRYVAVRGSFRRIGRVGLNRFRFTGRLRGRRLPPGRYRLVAAPRDLAGNRSPTARRAFRVIP
jgi:hypothetical protein